MYFTVLQRFKTLQDGFILPKMIHFLKKGLQFRKRCGIITKPSDETANRIVGVDYNEGPPVPIPNTEVKLVCAENTRLATARDDRLAPTLKADIQ